MAARETTSAIERLVVSCTGRRARWIVLALWAAALAASLPFERQLNSVTATTPLAFAPRSAESTRAAEILGSDFGDRRTGTGAARGNGPGPGGAPGNRQVERSLVGGQGALAVVTYRARSGRLTRAERAEIGQDSLRLDQPGTLKQAGAVLTPFTPGGDTIPRTDAARSADGTTALVGVPLRRQVHANVTAIRRVVHGHPNLEAHVAGPAGVSADLTDVYGRIGTTLLAVTVSLVLVVLLVLFRSPVIALLPLLSAGIAYVVAGGVSYGLAEGLGLQITSVATAVLVVLTLGAGTDYCLLTTSRFRDEIAGGRDPGAALERASKRVAHSIVAAAGIVASAMLLLLVADVRSVSTMGPVLAVGVAVAALAALTLLPALLSILGTRAFWPRRPAATARPAAPRGFAALARALSRRPAVALVAATGFLAIGALGNLASLPPLGFGQGFLGSPDSVRGERILDREYLPGAVAPVNVLTRPESAHAVATAIVAQRRRLVLLPPDPVSNGGRWQALTAATFADPFSESATRYVPQLRRELRRARAPGRVLVGGLTAQTYDTERGYASDARLVVPLILALIFLIFVALLRSLVAPLYLVATVLLSFAFALGASKLIFEELLNMPGLAPEVTILAFIFLVALGSDYNVFLLTRVAEERRGRDDRDAVLEGLLGTAGVITAAGLVLAGTFAALTIIPLTSMVQLGVTVALGVLVDALLVRTILVPSIALVLGRWSWWPPRWSAPARGA